MKRMNILKEEIDNEKIKKIIRESQRSELITLNKLRFEERIRDRLIDIILYSALLFIPLIPVIIMLLVKHNHNKNKAKRIFEEDKERFMTFVYHQGQTTGKYTFLDYITNYHGRIRGNLVHRLINNKLIKSKIFNVKKLSHNFFFKDIKSELHNVIKKQVETQNINPKTLAPEAVKVKYGRHYRTKAQREQRIEQERINISRDNIYGFFENNPIYLFKKRDKLKNNINSLKKKLVELYLVKR